MRSSYRYFGIQLLASILFLNNALHAHSFKRGDVDGLGSMEISDAIRIFGFLFLGNPVQLECADSADANDSGMVDLSDGVYILNFLFGGGAAPPNPYPECHRH